jgi:hypothetical protein
MGHIGLGPLLILDALLHILIVEIEVAEAVISAIATVIVGEDGLEDVGPEARELLPRASTVV